ncbi:MAG: sodium:proton exchanger [Fuerstiella sp.]|nr:sodium:proton exchanger [Fuerstiella sp.]MCP4855191.1 sodium:proton exchanger [Fuerstiella sp.]
MLVLVGGLLLAGYAAHLLGGRLHVPRVTLLILLGVVCGPYFLNIVPATMSGWFTYVAHFALAMVGFLLGEGFVGKKMKSLGWAVLTLPLTYVFCAAFLVFLATFAVEWSVVTALVLAGIAPSSAPAATVDVIRENHAAGQLAKTLLRVVAIDDAFGIVLFSLLLATAEGIVGERAATTEILLGLWEVVGALLLGVMLGLPMAWLTGRLRKGEPAILEAAGFVFLCGGLATLLDVSYLLACMVLGTVVANRAKHYTRPFHAIEGASDPFLAVFFVLAGFRLELDALTSVGLLGIAYILSRAAGLILGGRLGARIADAPPEVQKHIGWCLLPQAGVALGLALLAAEKLPEIGERLLPLIIASTVVFEVIGPISTQRHLRQAGELGQ